MLKGKKIILGITGSIAAYKAAVLLRLLVKAGAEVKVLMTALAKEFVSPLTFATLSKNPVLTEFFNPENGDWNSHVDMGTWADIYVIAPATANTMAKMASGIADNLLLTTYLSVRCPVMVAPAMDLDMLLHPATQKNIKILKSYGNIIIEPTTGELASGLSGKGRMEEPEYILKQIESVFKKKNLNNKKILVTAGPTMEPIDPVRFIGNHSSGKMGYALATAIAERGAEVELVSGPVKMELDHPLVKVLKVNSADEMYKACMKIFPEMDGAVLCAAVSDYTPENFSKEKIKEKGELLIKLKPTKDIAEELGKIKTKKQVLAGFALETSNEIANAKKKLKNKNFDFIVLNSLKDEGAGFQSDTNKITIIEASGKVNEYKKKPKPDVADDIVDMLVKYF